MDPSVPPMLAHTPTQSLSPVPLSTLSPASQLLRLPSPLPSTLRPPRPPQTLSLPRPPQSRGLRPSGASRPSRRGGRKRPRLDDTELPCPFTRECCDHQLFYSSELLEHLRDCHDFPTSRPLWDMRLRSYPWYQDMDRLLRSTQSWLCHGCFTVSSWRTRDCSRRGAACHTFWAFPRAGMSPPPDQPVLVGFPVPPGIVQPPADHAPAVGGTAAPGTTAPLQFPMDVATVQRVFSLGHPTYRFIPYRVRRLWSDVFCAAATAVADEGTVEAWCRFLLLPQCVLSAVPSSTGGGTAAHVRRRLQAWTSGDTDSLLRELFTRGPHQLPLGQRDAGRHARALVGRGRMGAAVRALSAQRVADASDPATLRGMELLHPHSPPPSAEAPEEEPPLQCTVSDVESALASFDLDSAGARDGLRPQHIHDAITRPALGLRGHLLTALSGVVSRCLAGDVPAAVAPFISSAHLTPLLKDAGGLRPIAVGLTLRRLVSKVAVAHVLPAVSAYLQPLQFGVGVRGGAEAVVHSLQRYVTARGASSTHTLVSLDFSNAFNAVHRQEFMDRARDVCPGLLPWLRTSYGGAAELFLGSHSLQATSGVQQGDPLGPLLFALAIHPILQAIQQACPDVLQAWYLDDGRLCGDTEEVERGVRLVQELGAARGLSLNASKSELWWPQHDSRRLSPTFQGFFDSRAAGTTALGAPISLDPTFRATVVRQSVARAEAIMERLESLQDPQAELLLLRSAMGVCRITYALRCVPPEGLGDAVAAFDLALRGQLLRIIGPGFAESQWDQSRLPPLQGGLGLPAAVDLHQYAHLASHLDSSPLQEALLHPVHLAPEPVAPLRDRFLLSTPGFDFADLPTLRRAAPRVSTQHLLGDVHARTRRTSLHRSLDRRGQVLLDSLRLPHASEWLRALPDQHLGMWMDPQAFRSRVRYQLRIPLWAPGEPCSYCSCRMDEFGDHALHCGHGRGVSHTFRHHLVRDTFHTMLRSIGFSAPTEPSLPSAPGLPVRRADLLLPQWERGHDVYVDFTGASPFTSDRLSSYSAGSAAADAAAGKDRDYEAHVAAHEDRFIVEPFAWETLGGLEPRAVALVARVQACLREAFVVSDALPSASAACRISFVIARGVGLCLSARLP